MIQLRTSGLIADRVDVEQRRREFCANGWVRLANLLDPRLLQFIGSAIDRGCWTPFEQQGFDSNEVLVPNAAVELLQFVTNWPAFLSLVSEISGSDRLTWFGGRIYRMRSDAGHHDGWHTDFVDDRVAAFTLNVSLESYDGGLLQIKRRGAAAPHAEIANQTFGDAILFHISDDLLHRVTEVTGTAPKVAYAGWFSATAPSFADRLRSLS